MLDMTAECGVWHVARHSERYENRRVHMATEPLPLHKADVPALPPLVEDYDDDDTDDCWWCDIGGEGG